MIANEAEVEGDFGFEGIANGCGNAGVWDGDDDVGVDGMFAGQNAAEGFAAGVDGAAEDDAVGSGEIDMLKNALLVMFWRGEVDGLDAGLGDADHFAGGDFADVLRVEEIESTGFGGDHPGFGVGGGGGELAED